MRPDPEAFVEALDPLQPRLYSISSLAQEQPECGRAHRRRGALPHQRPARAPRRRLDVPRRARRARRTRSRPMCRRRMPSACRADPANADHHDRSRHRRRAVPRLSARAHGDQGVRPQLAVLRPPAARLRFLLRRRIHRHEGSRRADAPVARLVARRRSRNSTCRIACARSAANCGPGSPRARTFTSAATASAWPRTSSARWSTSSPSTARARPMRRSRSWRTSRRQGRYQQDVY